MEFYLYNEKTRKRSYMIVTLIVLFIMCIIVVPLLCLVEIESKSERLMLLGVAGIPSLLITVFFVFVIRMSGTKKQKIVVDEIGIGFISPKTEVTLKWEDIGAISIFKQQYIYIFNKLLNNAECKAYIRKGITAKNLDENLLYIEYSKEFYRELKKYYKDEVLKEYTLAEEGAYEA